MSIRASGPGFTPAFGTVGAPTIAVGTTGFNILDANTLQAVIAGAQVAAITAGGFKLGGVAVDTGPVAQTLSVQNVLAGGTSNVAGAAFNIDGSQGKGTGAGGSVVIRVAPAGSTGTSVNALATGLTISSPAGSVGGIFLGRDPSANYPMLSTTLNGASGIAVTPVGAQIIRNSAVVATFDGSTALLTLASGIGLKLGNAATTGLGAGVVAALTNATVVFLDSTGQAYRVPCII